MMAFHASHSEPVRLAQIGLGGAPDLHRFRIVARVQPVRLADAPDLSLAVAAGQWNLDDAR